MRILLALLISLIPPAHLLAEASIMVCTFSRVVTFDPDGKHDVSVKVRTEKPFQVIFAGLDTDFPKMKTNIGEGPLKVLRRDGDAIWLTEEPLLGGVNVWTVFFDVGVAILSKQYKIGFQKPQPFGLMPMGHCK